MIIDLNEFRFFLRPGPTDLRKAINGLTLIAQNEMKSSPFSKSMFLFCNKTRKLLKILYWDKTGFCLWQKRLEKEMFPWPRTAVDVREIDHDQLAMLLSGIDFFHAHQELKYSRV